MPLKWVREKSWNLLELPQYNHSGDQAASDKCHSGPTTFALAKSPIQIPLYPREIDLIPPVHEGGHDIDEFYPLLEEAMNRDPFDRNPNTVRFNPPTALDSLILRFVQRDLVETALVYPLDDYASWIPFLQNLFSTDSLKSIHSKSTEYLIQWLREIRYQNNSSPEPMDDYPADSKADPRRKPPPDAPAERQAVLGNPQ